jgi:hypothetical protein
MSTKITVNNNGSLKVEGEFTIVDREGNAYDCDGAHNGQFEHQATAFALPPKKV